MGCDMGIDHEKVAYNIRESCELEEFADSLAWWEYTARFGVDAHIMLLKAMTFSRLPFCQWHAFLELHLARLGIELSSYPTCKPFASEMEFWELIDEIWEYMGEELLAASDLPYYPWHLACLGYQQYDYLEDLANMGMGVKELAAYTIPWPEIPHEWENSLVLSIPTVTARAFHKREGDLHHFW